MGKKKRIGKYIIIVIVIIICIGSIIFVFEFNNKKVKSDSLRSTLEEINLVSNSVFDDIEDSEKKYLDLMSKAEDPLEKGMYASALVQISAIKSNYDDIKKYYEIAIENYKKVDGGEFYIIAEKKHMAWVMLRMGKHSDGFIIANELLELINSSKNNLLTEEEIKNTEALVYSIFLNIYSEYKLKENAKEYYNKLNAIDMSEELKNTLGDKIAYSNMLYAELIEDYSLMKQYAEECYEISLKNDRLRGTSTSEGLILNIAIANINLGNLNTALNELKVSEQYANDNKDRHALASTYFSYAKYYEKVKDNELATKYYKKAIELYSELDDKSRLIKTVNNFIKFCEGNNVKINLNEYYKLYYNASNDIGKMWDFNNFLENSLKVNDKLNASIVENLRRESESVKKSNMIFFIMIIVLISLLARMMQILKKKNISENKLREIANKDYLTGVKTRSYGYKLLSDLINKKVEFSLGILDIDDFKYINDKYGHIFGDEVLKVLARTLEDRLEIKDIIIRFGGEEFIIAFVGIDEEKSKIVLDSIREELNSKYFKSKVRISFSAGIASWNGESIDEIVNKVDELLYEAKRNGKNRILIKDN
ncbi:MAG: tetratricopeptide repeat-containing diguanylate cyclase [Clostridium sp.]|uniref:tetratricopeptide repeat-containing diguanylate cyclase n=1 Tax=Clostridium sp. TaxID=1506 RepID=UPI002FC65121